MGARPLPWWEGEEFEASGWTSAAYKAPHYNFETAYSAGHKGSARTVKPGGKIPRREGERVVRNGPLSFSANGRTLLKLLPSNFSMFPLNSLIMRNTLIAQLIWATSEQQYISESVWFILTILRIILLNFRKKQLPLYWAVQKNLVKGQVNGFNSSGGLK